MATEFDLISTIQKITNSNCAQKLLLGIGDDCAVLQRDQYDLVTTDTLVENVHFSLDYMSSEDIGYRSLAVSLSDIAAMGGVPGPVFINLSLPTKGRLEFIEGFYKGILSACEDTAPWSHEVIVAGGDLTRSPQMCVVTTTLLGRTFNGRYVSRRTASVGDLIAVTGTLGNSAAGFILLEQSKGNYVGDWGEFNPLVQSHCRPKARVELGIKLGEQGFLSSMIDISDGFLQDISHIANQSGVRAFIDSEKLPLSNELKSFGEVSNLNIKSLAFSGGEDFELVLVFPETHLEEISKLALSTNVKLTVVGHMIAGEGDVIVDGSPWSGKKGWEHW